MQGIFKLLVRKNAGLLFLFFIAIPGISQSQTPTQQQINEMLPNGIDPTQMTKSGFDNYFRDNNQQKNTGNDKNKENPEIARRLQNKSLDKDSTQIDHVKREAYSPDQ